MTLQRRFRLVRDIEADWMASALKVAFATSDRRQVDQHFGAAKSFAIYAVDPEKIGFVEASEFGQTTMDGNEDKLAAKIAALDGCAAVYIQAVGTSAIRQLKERGIQPMKVSPGAEIKDLLAVLQTELRESPAGWLAQAIARVPDPTRFDLMEAEGWEE
ncbi:MAG: nitrogen fixation protein NifX [Gammaproteobacteria bacterium RIFOXYA12_FULL_61_12]|nr:MAG: nitrogen fixation protein NifX [Gammaproteobacteria bacterium RIFOXYA12_FULL_61_12]